MENKTWFRGTRKNMAARFGAHDVLGYKRRRERYLQPNIDEFNRQHKKTIVIMIEMHGGDYISIPLPPFQIKHTITSNIGQLGLCNFGRTLDIYNKINILKDKYKTNFIYGIKTQIRDHNYKSDNYIKKEVADRTLTPRTAKQHIESTNHNKLRNINHERSFSIGKNPDDIKYMGIYIINTFNLEPNETEIFKTFMNLPMETQNLSFKTNLNDLVTKLNKNIDIKKIFKLINEVDRSNTYIWFTQILKFFELLGFEYIHIIDYSCRTILGNKYSGEEIDGKLSIENSRSIVDPDDDIKTIDVDSILRKISSDEKQRGDEQMDDLFYSKEISTQLRAIKSLSFDGGKGRKTRKNKKTKKIRNK